MNNKLLLLLSTALLTLAGCATTDAPVTSSTSSLPSYASQPIARNTYELPPANDDVVGQNIVYKTQKGDTLDNVSQRFSVGANEMHDANPRINPERVRTGTKINIPKVYVLPPQQYRKGIVINVAELRLYYFGDDGTVMTFPVAIGREGWNTPLGKTYVFRKQQAPTWNVPKSIRDYYFEKNGVEHPAQVAPGPENPLGDYAIYLTMNGYLIHGTNDPRSIGRLVSSGCIRMYNEDVSELFQRVKRGTPVNIIYYPNKAGWNGNKLYLESHTPITSLNGEYETNQKSAEEAISEAASQRQANINPQVVATVLQRHSGIPTEIGQG